MTWKSNTNPAFRTPGAESFFNQHFRHAAAPTWADMARSLVPQVCGGRLGREDREQLIRFIAEMKLLPSPAMLRRAGRASPATPACVLVAAEGDAPAQAGRMAGAAAAALAAGSGLGVDYGALGEGRVLPAMHAINELGRAALATGAPGPILPGRPAAILAGLPAGHPDLEAFLAAGDGGMWRTGPGDGARLGPFDLTARLVRFDTAWLLDALSTGEPGETLLAAVRGALSAGVALGFDLFEREPETLRGPVSGSTGSRAARMPAAEVNLSRIESLAELADVTQLATRLLLCDVACASETMAAGPGEPLGRTEIRLALGLTGLHEWTLRHGPRYGASAELGRWLAVWQGSSAETAAWFADALGIPRPSALRAVGSDRVLARLAGTTAGVEPIAVTAYRTGEETGDGAVRVHPLAQWLSQSCGLPESEMESGLSLAGDIARSLDLQAQVQSAVDQSVSAVIRLPAWGSEGNGEDQVAEAAELVTARAHLLRSVILEPEGLYGRPARRPADAPRKGPGRAAA